MQITNGIVSFGGSASTKDIETLAQYFGVPPRQNTGYDLADVCKNSHINAWSKKKPVKWNQWEPDRSLNAWWKTANGMCGFKNDFTAQQYSQREVYTELSSLAAEFIAGRYHPWIYEPPTGGSAAPYRLLDFDGYSHFAQSPAGQAQTGIFEVQNGNTAIGISYPDNDDGYSLTVDDFPGFSVDGDDFSIPECYPGIMLVNGNTWVASTLSTKMKNLTLDVWNNISFTGATTVMSVNAMTSVKAFLFFSSVSFVGASSTDENDTDGVFMSGFGVEPIYIQLHRYGMVAITTFGPAFQDSDLKWENATVTCPMVIGVPNGTTASLTNPRIYLAKLTDVTAYENETIDLTTFRSRYYAPDHYLYVGSLALNPSAIVQMSINASEEDGFDPSETWNCVLEADNMTLPVIDHTAVDTNPDQS